MRKTRATLKPPRLRSLFRVRAEPDHDLLTISVRIVYDHGVNRNPSCTIPPRRGQDPRQFYDGVGNGPSVPCAFDVDKPCRIASLGEFPVQIELLSDPPGEFPTLLVIGDHVRGHHNHQIRAIFLKDV